MARKATGQAKAAAAARAAAAAKDPAAPAPDTDLQIMDPDSQVIIDGQVITVREYRFFEGARVRLMAKPFFDALYALFSDAGAAPSFDEIVELIGQHEDDVAAMVAAATGLPPARVKALDDADGEALLLTWWMVNAGFFTRRVLRRAAHARLQAASQPDGPASSTTSSPPGT
ncbi:DUF6631 family protein [Luteimonas terricola]|uniref:Tail assembly chaperone n=1 Tax=Luteimonas terricola TaxID=645597 RepID=A0ABQ2EEB8_9GAMM|nr:DUF6631 family protein [Luteimonas terricola]GGK08560.1 hypothetical protein GCM10011394_17440 [Luteimonas terricola]